MFCYPKRIRLLTITDLHTKVTESQDSLTVGNNNDSNSPFRPVLQEFHHSPLVSNADEQAPWSAKQKPILLTDQAHGRSIDDWKQLFDVFQQHSIEKPLVSFLQSRSAELSLLLLTKRRRHQHHSGSPIKFEIPQSPALLDIPQEEEIEEGQHDSLGRLRTHAVRIEVASLSTTKSDSLETLFTLEANKAGSWGQS